MLTIIICILVFFLLWAGIVNYLTTTDLAKKKGYESFKRLWPCIIPIYGNLHVRDLTPIRRGYSEVEYRYLTESPVMVKRIFFSLLMLVIVLLIATPVFLLAFLAFKTNFVLTLVIVFLIILALLLQQGLTVEYAAKKGYESTMVGVIGLIPIYGLIHYMRAPKIRNISGNALTATFSPKNIFKKILVYSELTILSVVVLVPVIYIFGMAFSGAKTAVPTTIWPDHPTWDGFSDLFNNSYFGQWYLNTILIAIINMTVGTIIITGAAYVFARFSFKGKKAGLLTILVLQAFPSFLGLLAMYVLFWRFGLLGQPLWLSVLYIGGSIPGNLWLIKGFLSQIPKDLDESAMIDGASKLRIFVHIILPLAIPILTFVAVGMFMAPWMDYMLPGYLLNFPPPGSPPGYQVQQQWTLAVGIFSFINDASNLNYSAFAAASLIVGMPIAILYMVFQKYLIEGIMAGATKG